MGHYVTSFFAHTNDVRKRFINRRNQLIMVTMPYFCSGCLLKRFIVIFNCNRRSSNRSDFTCYSLHHHGHRHRLVENPHWFLASSCHIIIWFDQHLKFDQLSYSHKGITIQISTITIRFLDPRISDNLHGC